MSNYDPSAVPGQQLLTHYAYNNFGSLTNTAYSDGTPSVSFTFNALGQMKTVTDASGTRTLDYAVDSQLIAEHLAFGTSLFTLHEKFDTLGRNAGYALSNEVALITGTMQSFDLYGLLNQVAVDGISGAFAYGYLEGSHLQKKLAMPNGVTRTFGYEPNRDLLTMIVHSNATERLVQRDFTFDGLARLQNRTLFRANESPAVPDAFGYNIRSELTNAVIGINAFSYAFDPIGNRFSASEFGTNTAYITSALNQYTSISNSVNNVPLCEMNPEFDADGNQTLSKTTTGIWHLIYNGENRPILFSNDTTKVEMAYDYMGRRFEYKETVNGILTRHERYLYRGYLQLVALDMLSSASVKHAITWDPSGRVATRPLSFQIGANAYFYSFDQVKNVTELFDSTGTLVATYDYSPFGQVTSFQITQSGNNALTQFSNPLTFSSEIHDPILGLQYYNYRNLNLLDGRWLSRDPIEDRGGVNLYLMGGNRAFNVYDSLGLKEEPICKKCPSAVIEEYEKCMVNARINRENCRTKTTDVTQKMYEIAYRGYLKGIKMLEEMKTECNNACDRMVDTPSSKLACKKACEVAIAPLEAAAWSTYQITLAGIFVNYTAQLGICELKYIDEATDCYQEFDKKCPHGGPHPGDY